MQNTPAAPGAMLSGTTECWLTPPRLTPATEEPMAKATETSTTISSSTPHSVPALSGRVYTLRLDDREVLVDAGNKGAPGDTVILWPKKKCPVAVRRLARVCPYPGESDGPAVLSDRYYFADLETGDMFDLPISKTAAIHKVVGDL